LTPTQSQNAIKAALFILKYLNSKILSMKVVLANSRTTILRLMRQFLAAQKITDVTDAEDAESALSLLHESKYDLIIADENIETESMSCLDLVRQIRADKNLQKLPFIMTTYIKDRDRLIAAKEAGVNECILEPTIETLKTSIDRVMGVQR
jgi:two-component system chemotaxis response regulator CheY